MMIVVAFLKLSDSYTYEYDHAERLVKALHRLGDAQEVILIDNVYDDLGRLSRKTFHNGLLNTSYSYNIRSWLTGITGSSLSKYCIIRTERVFHITMVISAVWFGNRVKMI